MSKLHFYKTFKTSFTVEPYLLIDIPRRLQVCLSRFRTTSHNLECEKGRHPGTIREDILCKLCGVQNKA